LQTLYVSTGERGGSAAVAVSEEPSVTVIGLSGVIDVALDRELHSAAQTAVDRRLPVRVDVSRVTFIDSEGLSLVAHLIRNEERWGRSVTVVGSSAGVRQRLTLAGLDRLVIFED
jgi:anti-anti-sigma factor